MSTADHTISRTSPIAELAPDAPIIITRAMLTAAFRQQLIADLDLSRRAGSLGKPSRHSALAQANIDAYAAGKAYALLTQLHTVAQQIAAAQGATV
jgi:hypothetical protein